MFPLIQCSFRVFNKCTQAVLPKYPSKFFNEQITCVFCELTLTSFFVWQNYGWYILKKCCNKQNIFFARHFNSHYHLSLIISLTVCLIIIQWQLSTFWLMQLSFLNSVLFWFSCLSCNFTSNLSHRCGLIIHYEIKLSEEHRIPLWNAYYVGRICKNVAFD